MKIIVIESSPHKNGSSNYLAEQFIKGAEESGHQVKIFDAAHSEIHPCKACEYCRKYNKGCYQNDDITKISSSILNADIVVFVTPLYYFNISAQLKTVIDRFYAFKYKLTEKRMRTVLIASAWNDDDWTMNEIESYYKTLCVYLDFRNIGMILATGCGNLEMTKNTVFPIRAYELGKSI